MNEWMDEWMDGWMNEWMNEEIHYLINLWMDGPSSKGRNDRTNQYKRMHRWSNGRTYGWMDGCMIKRTSE
eukprot:scaffold392390_cov31-Prasinocladus_malaysianus.AAC.1